jgi:hypothetical protein
LQAYFLGVIQLSLTQPAAFDLCTAAPALVATMIAGLKTMPPLRAPVDQQKDRVASQSMGSSETAARLSP